MCLTRPEATNLQLTVDFVAQNYYLIGLGIADCAQGNPGIPVDHNQARVLKGSWITSQKIKHYVREVLVLVTTQNS